MSGLVLLSLAAVFFFVVVRSQPNSALANPTTPYITPASVSSGPTKGGIGPGSRPWMITYENGRLSSQFHAADYTPQKDGSFFVQEPISVFYMSDGQFILVTGDHGIVNCDSTSSGSSSKGFSAPTTSPKNGWLHHVRIELYPTKLATHASLWMETDNIHFDNDTMRMYTEGFTDAHGQPVAADKVPVRIRGDDYEFDGKGLTLQWNATNRRLQMLEVSHGQRLEIKNPNKLTLPGMSPATPPKQVANAFRPSGDVPDRATDLLGMAALKPRSTVLTPSPARNRVRVTTISSDSKSAATPPATPPAAPPVPPAPVPPTPYRAVFHDNVVIQDTERTMATAELMTVDFLQKAGTAAEPTGQGNGPTHASLSAPGAAAAPASPAPDDSVPPAATRAAANPAATPVTEPSPTGSTPPASTPPASAPANNTSPANTPPTKAVNGPVTITWTGKLLVTPLETQPPMLPLSPGQSVVRLTGSPVRLTPQGSVVTAAVAIYRSPDGAVQLHGSRTIPVKMSRPIGDNPDSGLQLLTQSIVYDPLTSIATLRGPSSLKEPVGKQDMTVHWTTLAKLHMLRAAGQSQPSGVDRVNLFGSVAVAHPQFSLHSQQLQLDLDVLPRDPTAPSSDTSQGGSDEQLKTLHATGSADEQVKCRLNRPGQPAAEGIDSNDLVIHTERGVNKQTVAREVLAQGNVRAFDPDQSLTAGNLDALLLPKSADADDSNADVAAAPIQPSGNPATVDPADSAAAVELESLHATAKVHAKLKTATADTDDLQVSGMGTEQVVDLAGPGTTLRDVKGSWLKGALIHITPAASIVKVDGPGMMETIRSKPTSQPVDASPPRPVDVSWSDSMSLQGSANIADVVGHVLVKNIDTDGTLSTITGDTAHLDLMDAPQDNKKARKPAATQPDDATTAMGGKQLKKLTLTGHVVGKSDLDGPEGSVLRQGRLFCNQLIYTTADGVALIPGSGKMFVENHKPAAAGAGGADQSGSNRGSMAIAWQKRAVYDQVQHTITFTGDTVVGFEQEPAKPAAPPTKSGPVKPGPVKPEGPMQLRSDEVVVTLADAGSGKPASTTAKPAGEPKMQLSHMQASGHVRFAAKGVELSCSTAEYDPKTSIMTARGSATERGQAMDDTGNVTGSFDEVEYDSVRQEVIRGKRIQGTVQK
jgi:hypothetical protein